MDWKMHEGRNAKIRYSRGNPRIVRFEVEEENRAEVSKSGGQ